jgi:hypothetical protein
MSECIDPVGFKFFVLFRISAVTGADRTRATRVARTRMSRASGSRSVSGIQVKCWQGRVRPVIIVNDNTAYFEDSYSCTKLSSLCLHLLPQCHKH